MTRPPTITARDLIQVLLRMGFSEIRSHGSHHRFVHADGRKTTVPVHAGRDIPRGLLHRIVVFDLEMTMDDFMALL